MGDISDTLTFRDGFMRGRNGVFTAEVHHGDRAPLLSLFFTRSFSRRDSSYGRVDRNSPYPRYIESGRGLEINFTMQELAEACMADFTSEELAVYFRNHAVTFGGETDPQTEATLRQVAVLDEYYRYGFVVADYPYPEKGDQGYWRIYSPDLTSEELAEIIPKKYWSRSKKYLESDGPNLSPMLKWRRGGFNYAKEIQEKSSRLLSVAEERDALLALRYKERDPNAVDLIQGRFERRWHHPLLLFIADEEATFGDEVSFGSANLIKNARKQYGRFQEDPRFRTPTSDENWWCVVDGEYRKIG